MSMFPAWLWPHNYNIIWLASCQSLGRRWEHCSAEVSLPATESTGNTFFPSLQRVKGFWCWWGWREAAWRTVHGAWQTPLQNDRRNTTERTSLEDITHLVVLKYMQDKRWYHKFALTYAYHSWFQKYGKQLKGVQWESSKYLEAAERWASAKQKRSYSQKPTNMNSGPYLPAILPSKKHNKQWG